MHTHRRTREIRSGEIGRDELNDENNEQRKFQLHIHGAGSLSQRVKLDRFSPYRSLGVQLNSATIPSMDESFAICTRVL
jgi:hypothetical protein